ncbi:hypothetical protein [Croceitalea sp. P059]|uniref:hypothetical protein n=1 Tax=Croceitalea sp. P059 TaxID=3075601 RepID=UPI002883CDF3|nr:hypothetical protein [Croceitalea sp. P059]MDT0539016.1 hypothetical protein [Croceitalea sp. P059]
MKYSLHICYLLVLIPFVGTAQIDDSHTTKHFYSDLAHRDALNEQQLILVTADDHKDFWRDQNEFEALLAETDAEGYLIYLNAKGYAYRLHQRDCSLACSHSEYYLNKAAFYAINGQDDVDMALTVKTKKPQVKN